MYKFNEDKILKEITDYIGTTYNQHYSKNEKIQTTEYIMSQFDDGIDFLRGCALKYLARYGQKEGKNKKDLLKAVHYIVLMMYYDFNDEENNVSKKNN